MIDPGHRRLSIARQCELASISRSIFYRKPMAQNEATLVLMRLKCNRAPAPPEITPSCRDWWLAATGERTRA